MDVVVVGSGVAGVTFAEKFRLLSADHIVLLTRETFGYYSRPLLSHGFTRTNIEETIVLKSFDVLRGNGVDVQCGVNVKSIDRERKAVLVDTNGTCLSISYDKLILAPGSSALIPPPFLPGRDLFFVLNSLADLKMIRRHRQSVIDRGKTPRWALIGGGLIGCEVASDLARAGDNVELFHAMARLMERQLVEEDSAALLRVLKKYSITVHLETAVTGFRSAGDLRTVVTKTAEHADFHGIIVACGFLPRTNLARKSGLAVDRGILVDKWLRTADEDIHCLGDAAECLDSKIYAYIAPIRHQSQWLAGYLRGSQEGPWEAPPFNPKAKVHGFEAGHPYIF